MTTRTGRKITILFVAGIFLFLLVGIYYWQAAATDMSNPHANFWRAVRHGVPGFTTVSSQGHRVLIENSGENWREVRNGFIMRGSQLIIGIALLAMCIFYGVFGKDRLEKPRSGVKVLRFTLWERVLHWYTVGFFIIMAVTGLSLLLGRLVLVPVFGHRIVSGYLEASKVLHNYCGPLLLLGILCEILAWVRYNIPEKADLAWFKNMGGMIGKGPRPHVGKVNGGEKGWFWLVVVFGLAVGITGITLDFPIWGQTRFTMQLSHVIHVISAVLFVTTSFGHIYVGTIGAEGVFEGMWTGYVDSVWAEQHNDLWYREQISRQGQEPGKTAP